MRRLVNILRTYTTHSRMESKAEEVVQIYQSAIRFPALLGAVILKQNTTSDVVTISTTWNQKNLDRGKNIKFQKTYVVDSSLKNCVANTFPVETSFELLICVSKSEKLRGVVKEIVCNKGVTKQFVEIWANNYLWKHFDLSAIDVHGDVYGDADFGSLDFDSSDKKLVYIAEKKLPKTEPFWKKELKENGLGDGKALKGEEYVYRADWGEQMVGRHQSVVVVCDIEANSLNVLDGIPPHMTPGQVRWVPGEEEELVGVAWETEPRRLGLVYCSSRRSCVFHLDASGTFHVLSKEDQAARSPRFSPDGQFLVWLERPAGGPHHSAMSLVRHKWGTDVTQVVVDIVRTNTTTTQGNPFYGLYNYGLPRRCWAVDCKRVLFSTPQRTAVASYVVNTETGLVTELEYGQDGSLLVLDVFEDIVVAALGSLTQPPTLLIAQLPPAGQERHITWATLCDPPSWPELTPFVTHYVHLSQDIDDGDDAACKKFSAIYFGPGNGHDQEIPLVVWPHGGPHGVFVNDFNSTAALFVLLGFGVLMVNYRGSVGAGQNSVDFLLGKIGNTDVKDVQYAVDKALQQFCFLNPNKMVLFGGSHGGFLVAHLSGQYPSKYKAVVARNPVIDVATMTSVTDIPDWNFTEAGMEYEQNGQISLEAMERMRKCSPINFSSNVTAPTLLLLGKRDLRVPCSQGLLHYHILKANSVETKVHMYDDNHPLAQVPVEIDNLCNSALWFLKHTASIQ